MAASELSLDEIYNFFVEKGGIAANRDVVRHFKKYLTDPLTQDDARTKFKKYVNQLATTKTEGNEKFLILRPKYSLQNEEPSLPPPVIPSPQLDSRNALGLPIAPSPSLSFSDHSPSNSPVPRQPPPYRPPPPVTPSSSSDNISISSSNYSIYSAPDLESPTAPPRRKLSEKKLEANLNALENSEKEDGGIEKDKGKSDVENDAKEIEKQSISVKERMQKFNKMASAEDELSPKQKDKKKQLEKGADDDDGTSILTLDSKRSAEWCVTAAKGDYQDLAKLASDEPRFVKLKDPYTTVLHWGAKHGNMDIIKLFAGRYRCDVNAKTSGGYTPLHIAAQFGHDKLYELLIDVYGANPNIRDYSGRFPSHYKISQNQADTTVTKKKGRKKTTEKDLGFLRIGSLNVRVKKTTEAFSNFLGVGNAAIISPVDSSNFHKGWGSADNVAQEGGIKAKRKIKRPLETSGTNSTPGTPNNYPRALSQRNFVQDSDSDSAAGFDSNWHN